MDAERELALNYQPYIQKDLKEPFPVRRLGFTVFHNPGKSGSFPGLILNPQKHGAAAIIEYAVYYDYDIQHMYDLEHIWVAVDIAGGVSACWSSFHGMRLRADRIPSFHLEGTHPVLYAQPGKHALLPDPELFWLDPNFPLSCGPEAGGGVLIPPMLEGALETTPDQDLSISRYIQTHFAFSPAMQYTLEQLKPEQFIPWVQLLKEIPEMVETERKRIIQAG